MGGRASAGPAGASMEWDPGCARAGRASDQMTPDTGEPLVRVDLSTLVPLPALSFRCGSGNGLAVCRRKRLLATSDEDTNTVSVFALPAQATLLPASNDHGSDGVAWGGGGPTRLCVLGGKDSSLSPMQFKFASSNSGYLAFASPVAATAPWLLLTDGGSQAVHAIDVDRRVHAGYVAAPGTIAGPRGVAARGSLVAVCAGRKAISVHAVHLFEYSVASHQWTQVRVLDGDHRMGLSSPGSPDGQLDTPCGVRFTVSGGGGLSLAVADGGNGRVSLFRVKDGAFVRHVATDLKWPRDVEECEGGWLVASPHVCAVEYVPFHVGSGACPDYALPSATLGRVGWLDGKLYMPVALAVVPDLGLAMRGMHSDTVRFFGTPDAIATASMSPCRLGWIVAVARGILKQHSGRP